ncbi:MAG: hypothetical protein ABIK62_04755, partial [candidate division WOR-3 bacterium]
MRSLLSISIGLIVPFTLRAGSSHPCPRMVAPFPAEATILDGEFLIDTVRLSTPGAYDAAVGFDGTNFLVAWLDDRGGLFAARVSPAGEVLDPNGIRVARTPDRSRPAVAFDGTNYLVVYPQYSHVRARRVSTDGSVLEPEIVISNEGEGQDAPAVAFDGTNYLVAWADYRVDNLDIYGARVSPTGIVLDTTSIPIADSIYWEGSPAVCATSNGFLVVWDAEYDPRNIRAARVTSTGQVLDHNGSVVVPNPSSQILPRIAFDGTNALVVWSDDRADFGDIYGARVTPAGQVLDSVGISIASAPNLQYMADICFDGTNYILAWEDSRNNSAVPDIYGARVTVGGQVLDTCGIQIMIDDYDQWVPSLAYGSGVALVLWNGFLLPEQRSNVQFKRVSQSGVVLDSLPKAIATYCPYQWDPAVAFDGTNYLVVWEDDRNVANGTDIYATRVSPTGQTLDAQCIEVCTYEGDQYYPAVTFDGVNYVVAWQDERYGRADVYAARITPAGQLLDSQAIWIAWQSGEDESYPTLVSGDTVTLIAWERARREIEGRRIGRSGRVLDQDPIELTPDERGRAPHAAFDGNNFLVVFHDDRDDTIDIFGTLVGQDGVVRNAEFRISVGDTAEEREARLAFDGTNYLVAWLTHRPGDWEVHATRVTPNCAVLDSPSILVDRTGREESDADLDVVADGNGFVVVWEDMRGDSEPDIYGARVSASGQVQARFPIVR